MVFVIWDELVRVASCTEPYLAQERPMGESTKGSPANETCKEISSDNATTK